MTVGDAYGLDRTRDRQGAAVVVDGVPYADPATTLSLLAAASVGEWLSTHRDTFRGRLLDAGCGEQPFRSWYAPLVDAVTTLDAAPLPGIDVLGFADVLPFADACFDVVLLTEVLEHVADAERAIAEAHRVLAPGGAVVVTVPFLYPVHEAPYDFRRLTHLGLRSLLERHGFAVESLEAKGGIGWLVGHYAFVGAGLALDAVGRRFGGRRPTAAPAVRAALVVPQQWLIRRRAARTPTAPLRGSSALASLGYMAVGRRVG